MTQKIISTKRKNTTIGKRNFDKTRIALGVATFAFNVIVATTCETL
jgi:hypothetical protein